MPQLIPYLTFKGNGREAMTFYKECLGGELQIMTYGESPVAAQMPKELHDSVMHGVLRKNDFVLMASDMMASEEPVQGNAVTLTLICPTIEELESSFSRLSAGGKVGHPLEKQFFGTIGDFTDKFGFRWMCVMMNPDQKM
jgi:PhnB protein